MVVIIGDKEVPGTVHGYAQRLIQGGNADSFTCKSDYVAGCGLS